MALLYQTMSTIEQSHKGKFSGFSLLEVVIALTVFMLVAFGITGSVLQSQQIAQNNIIRNTAYTVAQGYLEQIRTVPVVALRRSIDNPEDIPLPTKSVSALSAGAIEVEDPLFLDGEAPPLTGRTSGSNYKQILIDLQDRPGQSPREVTMDAWFDVELDALGVGENTFTITIRFEAALRGRGSQRVSGELRGVRADVNRISNRL